MKDAWTIKTALDWTEAYLARKGDENPRVSAQWLMSDATNLTRVGLYVNFDRPLSMSERDLLRGYVSRRGRGEPLQYITGEVGFRHLRIKVCPGVLIPRPETEVLVSEALATLPPCKRPWAEGDTSGTPCATEAEEFVAFAPAATAKVPPIDTADCASAERASCAPLASPHILVVDLCTGSGCIACSIAHEYPEARVLASDIAPEALELASENMRLLGLSSRIEILEGDLGEAIPEEVLGSINLVVANPPYIPSALLAQIPSEVADFEPTLALDGGSDGLDLYRRIALWAVTALAPGGALAVELHEDSLEEACAFAQTLGYIKVKTATDLAGRNRVLVATKPGVRGHADGAIS